MLWEIQEIKVFLCHFYKKWYRDHNHSVLLKWRTAFPGGSQDSLLQWFSNGGPRILGGPQSHFLGPGMPCPQKKKKNVETSSTFSVQPGREKLSFTATRCISFRSTSFPLSPCNEGIIRDDCSDFFGSDLVGTWALWASERHNHGPCVSTRSCHVKGSSESDRLVVPFEAEINWSARDRVHAF